MYFLTLAPILSDANFSSVAETVTHPAEPDTLLSVIESCAWLIAYYERTGVAPESLRLLRDTMDKAINDLEAPAPASLSEPRLSS